MTGAAFHPLFGQELNWKAEYVPDDPDGQVAHTIALMSRYASQDAVSTEILAEAQGILLANPGATKKDLTCAVWRQVQSKIQFVRDEVSASPLEQFMPKTYMGDDDPIVEVLIRPRDMAVMQNTRIGDCDDYAMYEAALLMALGIPCTFVTIAGDATDPGHFTHVYVAAYPNGERVAVDASHGPMCGWESTQVRPGARVKEWGIGGMGVMGDCLTALFAAAFTGVVLWAILK